MSVIISMPILAGRAIDHRKIIDDFVGKHRDLRHLDLTDGDWDSIILVTGWLKSFRTATTLMSTTKRPMLSYRVVHTRDLPRPAGRFTSESEATPVLDAFCSSEWTSRSAPKTE